MTEVVAPTVVSLGPSNKCDCEMSMPSSVFSASCDGGVPARAIKVGRRSIVEAGSCTVEPLAVICPGQCATATKGCEW